MKKTVYGIYASEHKEIVKSMNFVISCTCIKKVFNNLEATYKHEIKYTSYLT